jgi:hypothetical protein
MQEGKMEMMNRGMRIVLTLVGLAFVFNGSSQNSDTLYYRMNEVKKEEVKLYLPGFERKQDTCLYEEKWYDEHGRLTRSKRNEQCKGYPGYSEQNFTYNLDGQLAKLEYLYDNKLVFVKKWSYDTFGREVREESVYFDPYNEAVTTKEYYGPLGEEDSIYVEMTTGQDTLKYVEYQSFLAGLVMATSLRKVGSEKPISGTMHDYYQDRKIKKYIYMDYAGEGDNVVTLYSYNDEGRVSETLDDVNNLRAEFYYGPNGLLIKSIYFNRFGAPDQELFHQYKYYE